MKKSCMLTLFGAFVIGRAGAILAEENPQGLNSPDSFVRRKAIETLSQKKDNSAARILMRHYENEHDKFNREICVDAVQHLVYKGKIDEAIWRPFAQKACRDSSGRVIWKAVGVLSAGAHKDILEKREPRTIDMLLMLFMEQVSLSSQERAERYGPLGRGANVEPEDAVLSAIFGVIAEFIGREARADRPAEELRKNTPTVKRIRTEIERSSGEMRWALLSVLGARNLYAIFDGKGNVTKSVWPLGYLKHHEADMIEGLQKSSLRFVRAGLAMNLGDMKSRAALPSLKQMLTDSYSRRTKANELKYPLRISAQMAIDKIEGRDSNKQ